jgi:hypothetical protein
MLHGDSFCWLLDVLYTSIFVIATMNKEELL